MAENFTGDYAPEMFNEEKKYYLFQAQERANLTDAELRDLHNISNTNLRRFIQSQLGDCSINFDGTNDGFKIAENVSSPTNDFKIKGGGGTLDNPGVYYLNGYRLFLKSDITYSDQTNSGTMADDWYTNSVIPSLTTPTGTTNDLNAITAGGSNLIACGSDGTLIRSVDSGRNWSETVVGTRTLNDVDMGDASTGFAVGYNGTFIKTANGGSSWAIIPIPAYPSSHFYGVSLLNQNIGWIVGQAGLVLKTIDGGSNWSPQTSGSTSDLLSVSVADSLHIWASGVDGTVIYSDDGLTWGTQASGTTQTLNRIFAVDSTVVYAVGNLGTILRTSTSGASWPALTSDTTKNLYGAYFKSQSSGWVVGQEGIVLHTVNNGVNWNKTIVDPTVDFKGVTFSDTTGFIAGTNGEVYRTLNDGTSWEKYRSDYVYIDFHLAESSGDATSGSEYIDSALYDSEVGLPNSNRLRVVQDVKVSEGWPSPSDYIGPDGKIGRAHV